MLENSEDGVSPHIGVLLMVAATVLLLAVIAGFVFGMSGNISRFPFKMTINDSEKDHIDVYVSNVTTQRPIPNVQIGIYSYDKDTLLAGPLFTNDSGLAFFEIPTGFPDHFRVQGTYNATTYPQYIDKRPITVKMDEFLGNLSSPLYTAILGGLGALSTFAYLKRNTLRSIIDNMGKGKDEL